jgi:hypothetical protein
MPTQCPHSHAARSAATVRPNNPLRAPPASIGPPGRAVYAKNKINRLFRPEGETTGDSFPFQPQAPPDVSPAPSFVTPPGPPRNVKIKIKVKIKVKVKIKNAEPFGHSSPGRGNHAGEEHQPAWT